MYEVLVEVEKHHQGNKSEIGIEIRDIIAKVKGETK
jgi:hypothetical protein